MTTSASTRQQNQTVRFAGMDLSPQAHAVAVLMLGLTAASFAAVTVRLAQINGLPSPLIAGGRLLLACLVLTPLVLRRYRTQVGYLSRSDWFWSIMAGVWLGLHFTLMAFSLENTTVLVAQVIINTGPLWVAMLEMLFLRAKLPPAVFGALVVTMIGGGIIALASTSSPAPGPIALLALGHLGTTIGAPPSGDPALGAVLALAGAIAAAIYMTIGRKARAKISLVPYIWILYGAGGITGFIIVALTGTAVFGHPTTGYLWLLVITLVPQLIGHSSFNFALGYIPATVVSITTQAVTISAAVIAFFLFAEVPSLLEVFGSLVMAVGVLIAIAARRRPRQAAE
ncbi:MAG: DMT family transporter [Chloroflexota bacterium]